MKKTSFLLIFIGITLCSSCKKKGIVSHTMLFQQSFDTLVLGDPFEVEIIQDSLDKIEIVGHEPFVSNIKTTYSNNTLTISKTPAMGWLFPNKNKIQLKIHLSHISRIVANETCFIRSSGPIIGNELGLILKSKLNQADLNVQCNTFYFWNNFPCGGKLNLKGSCQELKLWNYALMQIDATSLICGNARVENSSKGDIRFQCNDSLFYKIKGEGNLHLYGFPPNIYNLGSDGLGNLIFH